MKKIKLNESALNRLIEESIEQAIDEGAFGDFAKKAGKGLAKAAIAGGLMGYGLKACDDQMSRYEDDNANHVMQMYADDQDVKDWIEVQGLDPNDPYSWVKAAKKVDSLRNAGDTRGAVYEARKSMMDKKIDRIIKESINKVLRG